ncbi:MAG: ABC transporter substrate-binding protein [Coriobacteriales bacterium]|jgi:ABC-type nitrate/sulfonate/bicarbonate transport system substrate-binding protein|nr:ABC transporter substrate-binding protein [Coriobacteriales bacterium]
MTALKKRDRTILIAVIAVVVVVAVVVGIGVSGVLGGGAGGVAGGDDGGGGGGGAAEDASLAERTVVEDGKELVEIYTYTRTDCGITPYLVADQKGYFADEGIKLVYTGTIGYDQQLATVVSGQNDLGDAHPNELALFVQGGAPVKGVSRDDIEPLDEALAEHRHMKYFVTEDSPITSWEDVLTYEGGSGEVLINGHIPSCSTFVPGAIFDNYGISRDRLTTVTFESDREALQAVSQGDITIAQVHPPFYKLAEESGLRQIGDSFDAGLGATTGTALYYFSNQFIEEHPDLVQKFVNAITKAQIWANEPEHFDEAAQITAEALTVEATVTHYYADDTLIVDHEIQPWIDDLVATGFLKEGEVEVSDIITHQFENPEIHK